MPDLNMPGVGSGIDWSRIIQYELQTYRRHHVAPLEERQESWDEKLSALSDLNGHLDRLQSAADAIDTPAELRSYSATSSDEAVVEADASAEATPGTYQVEINQLANAETELHGGLDEAETVVNNSGSSLTFAYTYASQTVSLSVPDGTTLEGLRDMINNDADNPGVTASILDDGGGTTGDHHLRLRGDDTGSSHSIAVDGATDLAGDWGNLTADASSGATSVTVDDPSAFQQYQAVLIDDADSAAEYHLIDSINTNTLNLRNALGSDFTTAQSAYATPRGVGSTAPSGGTAGTSQITVGDASSFQVGKTVVIADGTGSEQLTISAVDLANDALTFESNLANDYATDAYVTQLEGGRKFAFDPADFTEVQSAQDAQVRVDGYPSGSWIERETNSVDGVIDGVTLDLHGPTAGSPVTVTVSEDRETVKEKIREFVDAYNQVRTFLNEKTRYDSTSGESGVLLGNYGAELAESTLRDAVVTPAAGFQNSTDTYTLLGQVGIESTGLADDRTALGTLTVDETTLDEALGNDFEAVIDLFSENFSGASDSNDLTFYQCSDELTTAGKYDVEVDYDGSGNITGARMKLTSESTFRDAKINGNYVIGKSGNPEEALWVRAEWDGSSSTQTAVVRVKQGVAGEICDTIYDMQDTSDGLISTLEDSYNGIISELKGQIAEEEDRLSRMEERLRNRYARLEKLLADLQGLQSWTSSLSQSLSA